MPRRRGIFGRALRALRKAVAGSPPEAPRPDERPLPPPPVIAPKPPQPELPPREFEQPRDSHEARMQAVFVRITGGTTGYLDWREVYDPMSAIFDTDRQRERYWEEFLRAYYLVSSERGSVKRSKFHNDTGIPESQVDWELWRELKRGTP